MPEVVPPTGSVIRLDDHRTLNWDTDRLLSLQQDLAGIDQETEAIFLDLGGRIEQFHGRALGISSGAGDVLHLLKGDAGEGTLLHLQMLVERCHLWLNATQDKSNNICGLLESVKIQVGSLNTPITGLRKVIKTLHSLRVSTRIEAAKGYASGAGVLARSLDELGNMVYEKVNEIFDHSETLLPMIGESLELEQRAQAGSVRIASNEVQQARRLLNAFVENCIETGQWTDRLKDRSEDVAQNFGEMIVALQFQDITRQRLEHVQKALGNLDDHVAKLRNRADESNDENISRLFSRICRLQHDQIGLACGEFVSAADNLTENLHAMTSSILSMAGDTRELTRAAEVGAEHRFDAVLVVLRTIASHLDKTLHIHQQAGQQLAEVCTKIEEVVGLVEEVELVGEEMQLLAMNAAISAAHARQQGAGLDIIAQNIHVVAEEATTHALTLARECEAITSVAVHLQEIERETRSSSTDITSLLGEAQERMAMIEHNSLKLKELVSGVDLAARELADDVNVVVRTIDLKERFQEQIAQAMERLDTLGSSTKGSLNDSDNASLDAMFNELEYCYTMDSERLVHKQFIADQKTDSRETEPEADEWAANRQHDLGDNVDLF